MNLIINQQITLNLEVLVPNLVRHMNNLVEFETLKYRKYFRKFSLFENYKSCMCQVFVEAEIREN